MSDTLFLLRLEHGKHRQLLAVIEAQLAAARKGQPLDYKLLHLVADYFSDYPDLCHHPKEDLVYERLCRRDPTSTADLRDLVADHRRLHELTERFALAIHQGSEQPEATRNTEALQKVLQEFIEHYRQHMRSEEDVFFPLAENRLSKDDWAVIDFEVFDRDDPLFNHAAEKRFAALIQSIEKLGDQAEIRRSVVDAANGLKGLTGIDKFNASMKASEQRLRLARFTEGGYGLERDGELLLYIPECSSERAAWCAFCFLEGGGWPGFASTPSGSI